MTINRKPPSCARPRSSGRTHDESASSADAPRSRPDGRECEALAGPGGDTSGGSRPGRRVGPASPNDGPGVDLDAWLASAMEAEDEGDFVDRVFARMSTALWELDEMLAALGSDGRVSPGRRRALAAQLDHITFAHFQEWESDLLEGLDADEG